MSQNFIEMVRQKAKEKLLFLPHAIRQMSRPERMITTPEVHKVITEGVIIEDYPEDIRGHSCLILGYGSEDRPIHIVCSPKDEYLAIITAYSPDPNQWDTDRKSRRNK